MVEEEEDEEREGGRRRPFRHVGFCPLGRAGSANQRVPQTLTRRSREVDPAGDRAPRVNWSFLSGN